VLLTAVNTVELCEAIRQKIVAAYESGKGFKKLSKDFEIRHFTVYKWRMFKTTANMLSEH